MTEFDESDGRGREELMRRLELMESMVAEGRQTTMKYGWMFVLWGLVDLVGMGWQRLKPHAGWVWPVCLIAGAVVQFAMLAVKRRGSRRMARGLQCRYVEAVWSMMGIAMAIYVGTALFTHFSWQYSYVAGMLMLIGLAHAISAVILQWRIQGVVAAVWWAGAVAVFVCNSDRASSVIFLLEMCLGMIAFGIYVTLLERRPATAVRQHG